VRDWWRRGGAVALAAVLLLLGLAAFADQPAGVLAAVFATLVVLLAGTSYVTIGGPAQVRAMALRQRARFAGVPLLRDPDAPGRARPRAPSA
jgi:hypothetical protein